MPARGQAGSSSGRVSTSHRRADQGTSMTGTAGFAPSPSLNQLSTCPHCLSPTLAKRVNRDRPVGPPAPSPRHSLLWGSEQCPHPYPPALALLTQAMEEASRRKPEAVPDGKRLSRAEQLLPNPYLSANQIHPSCKKVIQALHSSSELASGKSEVPAPAPQGGEAPSCKVLLYQSLPREGLNWK